MKHFGRPRWRRVTLAVFFTFVLAIGVAPSAANGAQVSFCPTENGFVVVNGHPIMFDLTLTVGERYFVELT